MKKIFSILLSFAMVLGMGSVALAETKVPFSGEYPEQLTLKKVYDIEGEESEAPIIDKMTFTITSIEVLERKDEEPPTFGPLVIEIPAGEGSVNFPDYNNVGTYVYKITENTPEDPKPTAGVTYNAPEMELKVTVVENEGKFVVYQYAIRVGEGENVMKTDEAHNKYEAGSLVITKEVTGNFGDKEKEFKVDVTFKKPEGTRIGSVISYVDGNGASGEITLADWDDKETVTKKDIIFKHGKPITFNNIPKGVTWTVVEHDYSKEGYTTYYDNISSETAGSSSGTINSVETDNVKIVNNKNADVDTGISLDSIPYILILGLAVVGIGALFLRRRKNANF